MSNFFKDVIMKDSRLNSVACISDPNLLEPITRQLVSDIIAAAKAQGINLMIFETYRSQARQKHLFDTGKSKLEKVGVHHYGLACDIVLDVHGNPSWDSDFAFLGKLVHTHKMIWGGDWGTPNQHHSFIDADHVQRCRIKRQDALFAGTWYPDDAYNPYTDV